MALQAIAASINPGTWEKVASPEKNSKSFGKYMVKFNRWISVCGMAALTDKQKWDLLLATAGEDMEDMVVNQAGVEIRQVAQLNAAVGPPVVLAVAAVVPTPFLQGIQLVKTAILRYSNQIMARSRLFTRMPASNYPDWTKWSQELLLQAKRCDWEGYGAEQAALDALVYQCPDKGWKNKILGGKLDFQ